MANFAFCQVCLSERPLANLCSLKCKVKGNKKWAVISKKNYYGGIHYYGAGTLHFFACFVLNAEFLLHLSKENIIITRLMLENYVDYCNLHGCMDSFLSHPKYF